MPGEAQNRARWWGIIVIVLLCLVAGLGYGYYWLSYGRGHEQTDDAYVAGNVVAITSRENATVIGVFADNTRAVKQGELLVEMDPTTARIALDAARANLAHAVRATRGAFANADAFQAQLTQAEARLAAAQSDYQRRQSAMPGAVSREEVAHAQDEIRAAQAAVQSARGSLAQARASVAGAGLESNPDVLSAAAQLRSAAVTLSHMKLVAPVDGVVAQRTVQVGQRVSAGAALMAVVPLGSVWVDANFKEVQLSGMRIGQPVKITTDLYGSKIVFHGRIEGLSAGSGNAFALLPPQNASGNWIKIVQRVPVRIALDPEELKAHPLRIGLSVSADIDVQDTSGTAVATGESAAPVEATSDEAALAEADRQIARIIAANRAAK